MPKKKKDNQSYLKELVQLEERAPNEVKSIVNILNLKPKAKILDLCCGYGRHAIPLIEMGYRVTGFEISKPLYENAKEQVQAAGLNMDLYHGDMRRLPQIIDDKFDAVINIFTAFGFYNKESDNQRALNGAAKLLNGGGYFLIDLANRENILKHWQSRQWYTTGGIVILEESVFDFFSSRLEIKRTYLGMGRENEVSNFSIRLYSLHEMLAMIKKAGMISAAVFGDFDMNQFSTHSRRMIILAQKH